MNSIGKDRGEEEKSPWVAQWNLLQFALSIIKSLHIKLTFSPTKKSICFRNQSLNCKRRHRQRYTTIQLLFCHRFCAAGNRAHTKCNTPAAAAAAHKDRLVHFDYTSFRTSPSVELQRERERKKKHTPVNKVLALTWNSVKSNVC